MRILKIFHHMKNNLGISRINAQISNLRISRAFKDAAFVTSSC